MGGNRAPRLLALTLLGLLPAAAWAASGCAGQEASPAAADSTRQLASASLSPPFRFFSPSSFWNAPPPADAPVDPESPALVAALVAEVGAELVAENGPWINTVSYGVPIYTVAMDQPTVAVRLASQYAVPALRAALRAVPLPPYAKPAAGSDRHLVVWQPGSDRLWEFWHLQHFSSGWQTGWAGAIDGVSANSGAYSSAAWPGADRFWGASATSLSIAGGLISPEELRKGVINHALALTVPAPRAGIYASPARRTDGTSSSPVSLPEGAHLRLDPDLDVSALQLPRVTRLIAKAAQRYGIFVRDKSRTVAFSAQAPHSAQSDLYGGESGLFGGQSPAQLLASFPWDRLEVLKMDLHTFHTHG
jgi:hypothetical protein